MFKTVKEVRDALADLDDRFKKASEKAEKEGIDSLNDEEKGMIRSYIDDRKALTDKEILLTTLEAQRAAQPVTHETPGRGISASQERDMSKFSIIRAIAIASKEVPKDGIELEMHQEAVKEARNNQVVEFDGNKGISIPLSYFLRSSKRDITATGGTNGSQGGVNIQTQIMGNIVSLDDALILAQAGAEYMPGLIGNYDLTQELDNFEPTWNTENGTATEGTLTYGKKTLTSKRLAGLVDISRQILIQTSPQFESRTRAKVIYGTARAIDKAGLYGTGASNQPLGLLNYSGTVAVVGGTNGAAPTRANIVALANGPGKNKYNATGRNVFVTNQSVREKLQSTNTDAGSGLFVWPDSADRLMGYDALVSTIIPNNLDKGTSVGVCSPIIFGDFSQVKIGQWTGITLYSDPYTKLAEGQIRLVVETYADVQILQPKAFAIMKDALTA